MKQFIKYFQITVPAAIVLLTASCEDFLTTPPVDRLTSDGFYQTPAQSEQGVIGIYAGLRNVSDDEFLNLSEFRSDNIWTLTQPDGFREYSEIACFRAGPDLSTINSIWNRWYKVIYDANVAIEKIPSCDFGTRETFRNQLLGEARFLRGWAYFELVRLFGNIPVIDKPMSPGDVLNVPQSSAQEVYSNIIVPDLTDAKTLLPLSADLTNASNTGIPGSGRADRTAAQAMLARVYMTMAGFPLNDASAVSLAKTELKGVMDFSEANGNRFWASDSTEWQKQWIAENNNKYSIFAIQYRSGGTGNPAIFNTGCNLPPSYTTITVYNALAIWAEKSVMYEFEKTYAGGNRDARGIGHSVILGYEAEPNWVAYPPQIEYLEPGSPVNVYRNALFYKYLNSKHKRAELGYSDNIETAMKDTRDWPVNYPVIRYEDILLMYAELLAGEGNVSGAMETVNRIRARAGCDAETASSAAEALAFVKRERRIELFGEGVRWFDLVRWNDWQQAITDEFNRYNNPVGTEMSNIRNGRYLYPIPLNQINVKPGWYTQNEGYN
jgi:hypothetical protein